MKRVIISLAILAALASCKKECQTCTVTENKYLHIGEDYTVLQQSIQYKLTDCDGEYQTDYSRTIEPLDPIEYPNADPSRAYYYTDHVVSCE